MALWLFTPVAAPDDPRWLNHPRFSRIVVRADTAALARLAATEWELPTDTEAVGNESHGNIAGAMDEKLYSVSPLPAEESEGLEPDGAPAVLQSVRDPGTDAHPAEAEAR